MGNDARADLYHNHVNSTLRSPGLLVAADKRVDRRVLDIRALQFALASAKRSRS